MGNAIHIAPLAMGVEFQTFNGSELRYFETLSKMGYDTYYWIHFLMLPLYAIGGAALYFFLFKSSLVPKWLSIWGFLASSIVFCGGALQLAEIAVPFALFAQNGIHMLVFIGYLIVMRFREVNPISSHE